MNLLQTLREAGNDAREDGMEMSDEVAYEMAACLMLDPEILKAAKLMWPRKSNAILQEIIADRL